MGPSAFAPHALPSPPHPCPSFQIPVTQACLMEDIEQWLSTDVVSWPRPAQEQRLGHIPPPQPTAGS